MHDEGMRACVAARTADEELGTAFDGALTGETNAAELEGAAGLEGLHFELNWRAESGAEGIGINERSMDV